MPMLQKGSRVKVVVTVPVTHADAVRDALGKAGAGTLGQYAECSFSMRGTGRFLPLEGSHPSIGALGKRSVVEEERIEVTVEKDRLPDVLAAVRKVHPYEKVPIDVYPLFDLGVEER